MSYGSLINRLPLPLKRWIRRRYYRRVVAAYQFSDWEWSPVVIPLIPDGSVVFDIGANVGYLSKLFAEKVGSAGRVVSVEPIPDTHDALLSSMKCFYPETVSVIQCCISDQAGMVEMVVPSYEGGGENYYESHIRAEKEMARAGHVFAVPALTLEQLVEQSGVKPDFIKIDVEGHELSVIKGGGALLREHKPPLLIEVSGDPDDDSSPAAQLFDSLAGLEYCGYTLENGQLRPRKKGDKEVDYLFLPRVQGL